MRGTPDPATSSPRPATRWCTRSAARPRIVRSERSAGRIRRGARPELSEFGYPTPHLLTSTVNDRFTVAPHHRPARRVGVRRDAGASPWASFHPRLRHCWPRPRPPCQRPVSRIRSHGSPGRARSGLPAVHAGPGILVATHGGAAPRSVRSRRTAGAGHHGGGGPDCTIVRSGLAAVHRAGRRRGHELHGAHRPAAGRKGGAQSYARTPGVQRGAVPGHRGGAFPGAGGGAGARRPGLHAGQYAEAGRRGHGRRCWWCWPRAVGC